VTIRSPPAALDEFDVREFLDAQAAPVVGRTASFESAVTSTTELVTESMRYVIFVAAQDVRAEEAGLPVVNG
jgi:hypothetical protein